MPLHPTIENMLRASLEAGRHGFACGRAQRAREQLAQSSSALGAGPEGDAADVALNEVATAIVRACEAAHLKMERTI